jgi:hypothetical protein
MNNAKWMLPVTMLLLSGLMTAQSLTNWTVAAQVPFEFVANNRIIPAGQCLVKSSSMDSGRQVLAIGNFSAHKSLLAQPNRAESKAASGKTVMIFKHYGDRYFLSSIRIEGSNLIYRLPESRAEVELRAQNAEGSQTSLAAALRY